MLGHRHRDDRQPGNGNIDASDAGWQPDHQGTDHDQ